MSLYRNALWYRKGWREYTRDGYLASKKRFDVKDLDIDCADKTFLVTGASSGIGKCIASEIARKAGAVHLVCRNKKTGDAARKEMIETTGNPRVYVHVVDMSRPRQIADFVEDFLESEAILDVLVNNAGCMVNTRELTPDALETTFATNVLGPYILTSGLMPLLTKSSEARVIMVSSGGILLQRLNVDDLQFEKMEPYDGTLAYAQTKRQLVVMAEQFAIIYPNIHFSSMNPGWVNTPSVEATMPEFYSQTRDKLRTPAEGADTAAWLAVSSKALKHPSGLFFQDRQPVPTHLPLAWTKASKKEEELLLEELTVIMRQKLGKLPDINDFNGQMTNTYNV